MIIPAIRAKGAVAALTVAIVGLSACGVALAGTPGTPSATVGHVYVASHDGAILVPFVSTTTLGHLALPAGSFTVSAKAWMQSQAGIGNSSVLCKLTLGASSDQGQADAQDGNAGTGPEPVRNEMLSLSVTGSISSASSSAVKLSCRNFGGGVTVLKFIKITAIVASGITKTTF